MFQLRGGKSLRIFTGDLHRLVGAWSSPVVLILGLTGAYFNTVEFYYEGLAHAEEHHKVNAALVPPTLDFNAMLEDSKQRIPGFTPTYLLLPYEPGLQLTVYGYQAGRNPFASNYASAVIYQHTSGEFSAVVDGKAATMLAKFTDSFRELHFGSFGGFFSKLLWSVLGFMPVVLAISGFYLWWRRTRKTAVPGK